MATNDVITPVVLLDASFWFRNNALTRGDIFELPNPQMTSILSHQEVSVSPVLETTLVTKDSYFDGIVRTSLGTGAAPVYVSSSVDDGAEDRIAITFDINVFAPDASGWTVKVDAAEVPVIRVDSADTKLTFFLETPIANGEVVTVEYVDTGKTVDADAGNFMATLVAQTVTNNVT